MGLNILSDQLCESCNGACCRDIVCPPSDPNVAGIWGWLYSLPPHLKAGVLSAHAEYSAGKTGPCIWLGDDGRCEHYELRPPVCRLFQPGGENCQRKRDEQGLT